jgi:hypothetical protein
MFRKTGVLILSLTLFIFSCKNKSNVIPNKEETQEVVPVEKRASITYSAIAPKDSIKKALKTFDSSQLVILTAVNRADRAALATLDTLIVPADLSKDVKQYLPFPFAANFLKDVNKIIFFSYPAQAFAAYEHGRLVYTGPTNMGRKADQTPTGLFYTNWKAEQTTSTFNDEWDLKWNFNIENKLGVGFHEYALPGYPASHSCLRLTEKDAKYLYSWADQWDIKGTDDIIAHGTPVVVFGSYPFGSRKPWLATVQNPDALMISEKDLESIGSQYLADVMQKQQERAAAGK